MKYPTEGTIDEIATQIDVPGVFADIEVELASRGTTVNTYRGAFRGKSVTVKLHRFRGHEACIFVNTSVGNVKIGRDGGVASHTGGVTADDIQDALLDGEWSEEKREKTDLKRRIEKFDPTLVHTDWKKFSRTKKALKRDLEKYPELKPLLEEKFASASV